MGKGYEAAISEQFSNIVYLGLTKRDYIAIMAMQSLISTSRSFDSTASVAYRMADAMIEESKK